MAIVRHAMYTFHEMHNYAQRKPITYVHLLLKREAFEMPYRSIFLAIDSLKFWPKTLGLIRHLPHFKTQSNKSRSSKYKAATEKKKG